MSSVLAGTLAAGRGVWALAWGQMAEVVRLAQGIMWVEMHVPLNKSHWLPAKTGGGGHKVTEFTSNIHFPIHTPVLSHRTLTIEMSCVAQE